jgi:hypothetical protein
LVAAPCALGNLAGLSDFLAGFSIVIEAPLLNWLTPTLIFVADEV